MAHETMVLATTMLGTGDTKAEKVEEGILSPRRPVVSLRQCHPSHYTLVLDQPARTRGLVAHGTLKGTKRGIRSHIAGQNITKGRMLGCSKKARVVEELGTLFVAVL